MMARIPVSRPLVVSHLALALLACNGGDDGEQPVFPADYAATYQEVRGCRLSLEHDLVRMRVLAAPDALSPYNERTAPFPTGAVVLKEQFDSGDTSCTGPLVSITVMQKLDVGSSPETIDWQWQTADPDHRTVPSDINRCTQCHIDCGKPPDGYDGTCTVP